MRRSSRVPDEEWPMDTREMGATRHSGEYIDHRHDMRLYGAI
jgi:hypothetical protein